MSFNNGPRIVTSGLVLSLDAADKNSYIGSGTIWTDLSGNNATGTLINSPTYNNSNNGVLTFNGTNQYVTASYVNAIPSGTAALTMCCWFYWTATSYSNPGTEIFAIGGNTVSTPGCRVALWIDYANSSIGLEALNSGKFIGAWSGANTWVHLCASVPANATVNTVSLYYNGNLAPTPVINGGTSAFNIVASQVRISGIPTVSTGLGYEFKGYISNVQVYNRALSATEIAQNYNATKSRFNLT